MSKKIVCALLLLCVLIFGCSKKTNTVDLTNTLEKEVNSDEIDSETTGYNIRVLDKNIEVILSMYSFDETTIEEYVAGLQEKNPDEVYSIYDESHYIHKIKESERKEIIKEFKSEEYIETAFQEIFADEQYGGAFISMEYDELFQNITFYVDKVAYDSAGIAVIFGPIVIGGLYSDIVQAYNLIPVEERKVTVLIIDKQTGDLIYDSSAENIGG